MIKIVEGSLLDATENIICHQVNCQGVMGSGIALQVKLKYPHVFEQYQDFSEERNGARIGMTQIVEIGDSKFIANLFGQDNYGYGKQHTDYYALENCLIYVSQFANDKGLTVALPYNLGCARGGGDWNVVYKMIEDIFGETNVDVTIYRYDLG